ncbi:hypothetical protein GCM10020255_002160 [Rhodococcus baikonurensis]
MIVAARWEKYPFPDPASMIRGGSGYVNAHLAAVSWAAALCLGVSLGISYGAFRLVYRTDKAAISDISAWRSVLRDDLPDPGVAYALVKMKSGTVWGGRVAKYTPDPEMANRELVLSPRCLSAMLPRHRWRRFPTSGCASSCPVRRSSRWLSPTVIHRRR